ncbi:MAG: hypothetical protein V1732_05015 [Patescibacteria group bacterium]
MEEKNNKELEIDWGALDKIWARRYKEDYVDFSKTVDSPNRFRW